MKLVATMGGKTTYEVGREIIETLTETKTILADDDCGKLFLLSAAAGFTATLPAIADAGAGWSCKFLVLTAPTSNGYTITEKTTADTNKLLTNCIIEHEVDTGTDGLYNSGHTTINLAANLAVQGDEIKVLCDGTNWYCTGHTNVDGGAVLA